MTNPFYVAGPFSIAVGAVIWYSYDRICSDIDRSCSLVKQTVLNLNMLPDAREITGNHCTVNSKIFGTMLQRKGTADISFELKCQNGLFNVIVTAHRQGMNWKTDTLELHQNGQQVLRETGK